MDIDRWQKRLETLPLGDLYLYKEVDSTNTCAEKLTREGAQPLSLVIADAQTAGRGRGGRTWITQPGQALAFSWILYPEPGLIQPETLGRLSGLGALAVAETLQDSGGDVQYILFGHDHVRNAQRLESGPWYLNTGSWLHKYATELKRLLREPLEYSFVRMTDTHHVLAPNPKATQLGLRPRVELLRWNDNGRRVEPCETFQGTTERQSREAIARMENTEEGNRQ